MVYVAQVPIVLKVHGASLYRTIDKKAARRLSWSARSQSQAISQSCSKSNRKTHLSHSSSKCNIYQRVVRCFYNKSLFTA